MATNKYIRGLTRAGFRVPKTGGGYAHVVQGANSQVDIDDHATELVLAGNRNTAGFIRVAGSGSTTATIIGLGRRGFRIPRSSDSALVTVKVGSGVTTVSLTNPKVERVLLRNKRDWCFAASATSLAIRGIQNAQNGFDVHAITTDSITSNNTNVSNADTVVVGTKTYTFKTALTEAKATAVLTSDNTVPSTGETVTINDKTYRFELVLAQINDVKIQGTADATLVSLAKAVNGDGVAGTDYFAGTTKPTGVVANETISAHALTLTASAVGTAANSFPSTETSAHLSFGGTTFSGGVNSVANEVKVSGTNADGSLTNLSEAINGGANAGVDYSSATAANTDATASAVSSHAITLTAIDGGSGTVTISTTATTLTVQSATLQDNVQRVYRGKTVTIDATNPFNYQQLRRHYDRWIEA